MASESIRVYKKKRIDYKTSSTTKTCKCICIYNLYTLSVRFVLSNIMYNVFQNSLYVCCVLGKV